MSCISRVFFVVVDDLYYFIFLYCRFSGEPLASITILYQYTSMRLLMRDNPSHGSRSCCPVVVFFKSADDVMCSIPSILGGTTYHTCWGKTVVSYFELQVYSSTNKVSSVSWDTTVVLLYSYDFAETHTRCIRSMTSYLIYYHIRDIGAEGEMG